jgi:DNA-binding response OmpR family regulator
VCCPRCSFHFVPDGKAQSKTAGRPTLLVVEDMEYFLQIARDALAERYDLKIAKTLDEARTHLIRGGIDLLLLDLTLEKGEDGLRLLREPPGKICPVLLFTAQDESEMYGEGWANLRALGVDDVIIKGMNMDEALSKKVAAMLGEVANQIIPLRIVLRRSNNLLVPEGVNILAGGQLLGHEADFNKGTNSVLQQVIVDLVHIRKVVNRLSVLVFVVNSNLIVEDGVEAHVAKAGNFFHLAELIAITLAKAENGPSRAEHLLPKMRKRSRGRVGIDHNALWRGL